jgi:hypothetical protein
MLDLKVSKSALNRFSFVNKVLLPLVILMISLVFTPKQAQAFSNQIFRIQSQYSPDYVVDHYGDNITSFSTKAHIFNKNQTSKTSLLRVKSTYKGSSEIAMSEDMNVCLSTELGLNQAGIKDGTKVIFKRDCANSNNWLVVNDTIRPWRNQTYCLDISNGKIANFTPLQMYKCNGSVAQAFVINNNVSPSSSWYDGSCWRKPDLKSIKYPCSFTSDRPVKQIAHKNGPGFSVSYTTTDNKNQFLGHIGPGGSPLRFPNGITKYDVSPWNQKETSEFSIEK